MHKLQNFSQKNGTKLNLAFRNPVPVPVNLVRRLKCNGRWSRDCTLIRLSTGNHGSQFTESL